MTYRKRYWRDSANRWRDRRNHNYCSAGPSGDFDAREYSRFTVNTPDPWEAPAPKPKRRKRKPKERPAPTPQPTDVLPHNSPPEFTSPFAKFLESVDIGHPNVIVSTYLILKRTSTSYISASNPNGVRVFAVQFGDMTRSEARKQTLADVNTDFYKFDTDWIPHIRALKGKNLSRTPASGDKTRSRIWKNIQKAKEKAKEEKQKKGKKTKKRHK
jgi:hypothetical protein